MFISSIITVVLGLNSPRSIGLLVISMLLGISWTLDTDFCDKFTYYFCERRQNVKGGVIPHLYCVTHIIDTNNVVFTLIMNWFIVIYCLFLMYFCDRMIVNERVCKCNVNPMYVWISQFTQHIKSKTLFIHILRLEVIIK